MPERGFEPIADDPLYGKPSYAAFVAELEACMTALAAAERVPAWE